MATANFALDMSTNAIAHLITSRVAGPRSPALREAVLISDLDMLHVLPVAMFFGYIIPTVLVAVPMPSRTLHQWLGHVWSWVPMGAIPIQYLLAHRRRRQRRGGPVAPNGLQDNIYELRRVYAISLAACAISHWAIIAIVVATRLRPFWFPPPMRDSLTLSGVFVPPLYWVRARAIPTMAEGYHTMFLYQLYIGFAASLVWVTALNANGLGERRRLWRSWAAAACRMMVQSVVAGPGGALVSLMWRRDEQVLRA